MIDKLANTKDVKMISNSKVNDFRSISGEREKLLDDLSTCIVSQNRMQALSIINKLLEMKCYGDAVNGYQSLKESFGPQKGLYDSQIGTIMHLRGHFEDAIKYYMRAFSLGASEIRIDDLIWSACEAQFVKNRTDRFSLDCYLTLFPDGRNVSACLKYLQEV